MLKKIGLIIGFGLVCAFDVYSEIYKCDVNGDITFSQFPCGDNAEIVNVEVTRSSNKINDTRDGLSHKNHLADINLDIAISQIEREINVSKNMIHKYQKKLKREISQLQSRTNYANNNLAGATYHNALSTQMTAVTTKYNSLIQVEQNAIDHNLDRKNRLLNKKEELKNTPINDNHANKRTKQTSYDADLYIQTSRIKREKLESQNKIKKK